MEVFNGVARYLCTTNPRQSCRYVFLLLASNRNINQFIREVFDDWLTARRKANIWTISDSPFKVQIRWRKHARHVLRLFPHYTDAIIFSLMLHELVVCVMASKFYPKIYSPLNYSASSRKGCYKFSPNLRGCSRWI